MDKSTPFTHPPNGWWEKREIEHLEAEVERLQTLLDAETESNHRLAAEELRLRAALAKQALKDDSDGT